MKNCFLQPCYVKTVIQYVCHYPCDVPNDQPIKKCVCFTSALFLKKICGVWSEKASWKDHERSKKKLSLYTDAETYVDPKLIKVKKLIEEEMVSAFSNLLNILKKAQEDIDYLNKECLSKDPISLEENMESIIRQELETQEDGHDRRIKVLKILISYLAEGFQNFEHAFERNKVELAKKIFNS